MPLPKRVRATGNAFSLTDLSVTCLDAQASGHFFGHLAASHLNVPKTGIAPLYATRLVGILISANASKRGILVKLKLAMVSAALVVSACAAALDLNYGPEPTTFSYTEPRASGLVGIRPFPNPDDVCMVIGENALTSDLLDDSALLIGCPKHEKGAIADRKAEGAREVGNARHWMLLGVPTQG